MRRRAEIVAVALMTSDVRRGIRARNHRLHFQHPFDVGGIAAGRRELRQDASAYVVLERHPDGSRLARQLDPDEARHTAGGNTKRLRSDLAAGADRGEGGACQGRS